MHNPTDLNHANLLPRMVQEMSVFAFIPLNIMAFDAGTMSTILTTILGAVVSIFAIRFYHAQTKKSNVEREVLEMERDNMKTIRVLSKKRARICRPSEPVPIT